MNYKVKNKYGEIRTATEEDKAELIKSGKRKEEDFIEESKYDSLVNAGIADPFNDPLGIRLRSVIKLSPSLNKWGL